MNSSTVERVVMIFFACLLKNRLLRLKIAVSTLCILFCSLVPAHHNQHKVSLKGFLANNKKKLTLGQKMKLMADLLRDVEEIQQPIATSDCFVVQIQEGRYKKYKANIVVANNQAWTEYSQAENIRTIGKLLLKAARFNNKKLKVGDSTYRKFQILTEGMCTEGQNLEISPVLLRNKVTYLIAEHNRILRAKKRASAATKILHKRFKRCHLSQKAFYKMALFIESKLPKLKEQGQFYFSRKKTALARTIEIDPATNKIYIHLKTHGMNELGRGARKIVTWSIHYSLENPKLVAHSETTHPNDNEVQAIKDLQGLPGLYKVISILDPANRTNSTTSAFISKYYSRGDLHHYLKKKKGKITFREKINIARDIMIGMESMHGKGYAHRDLGLKNYFVERQGKKIVPVIADFGRAVKDNNTTERGAQGGYSLCAPEGLAYNSLKDDDYFQTDIYALGCVFHKILFGRGLELMTTTELSDHRVPVEVRQEKLKRVLNEYRERRTRYLNFRYQGEKKRSSRVRFERLILQMLNPDPARRGTAAELRREFDAILKGN